MDNKRKVLIVSALLVAIGGFYIYKNMNMKSKIVEKADETPKNGLDTTKVLSKGSTGFEVELLQKALKGGLVVDGKFGALTEKRLKAVTGKTSISIREYNSFIASKTQK
jgi:hypothetical protein